MKSNCIDGNVLSRRICVHIICKDNLLIMKTEIYEYDDKSIPFSIVRGMMRYNKII
jgi:hypothetical protein